MQQIAVAAYGRLMFALALLGLGAEHLIFRQFVTGRPGAFPAAIPVPAAAAIIGGLIVIAAGVALILDRRRRDAAIALTCLIGLVALTRNFGALFTAPFLGGAWTTFGKALTLTAGSAIFIDPASAKLRRLAAHALGFFLITSGIQHFMFADFVATLIPAWMPFTMFWVYAAGVALATFGVALQIPRTTQWAGILTGLMIFSWFWVVHLPRTFVSRSDSIALFEALAFAGLGFVISETRPAK